MRISYPYLSISLLSFCFFTLVFHTIANAEIQTNREQIVLSPTPTIYYEPTSTPTNPPTLTHVPPSSTPTSLPTLTPIPPSIIPTSLPTTPTLQSPTLTPISTSVVLIAPGDLNSLFEKYSREYVISIDQLKKIAKCESGFNPSSNYKDLYLGLFQFSEGMWVSTRAGMGLDTNPALRTNPEESIKTAAYLLSQGKENLWPSCK